MPCYTLLCVGPVNAEGYIVAAAQQTGEIIDLPGLIANLNCSEQTDSVWRISDYHGRKGREALGGIGDSSVAAVLNGNAADHLSGIPDPGEIGLCQRFGKPGSEGRHLIGLDGGFLLGG